MNDLPWIRAQLAKEEAALADAVKTMVETGRGAALVHGLQLLCDWYRDCIEEEEKA